MLKKLRFLLTVFFFIAIASTQAQNLTAYFSYCTFNQPGHSPFIETYLSVMGNTIKFAANEKQKLQGKIEVQWVLKHADTTDNKIVFFDKYNLLSPELNSATDSKPNFLDQKRIPATNGNYVLELTISDKNNTNSKYTVTEKVQVSYTADKPGFSDIELLESYVKSETPDDKMAKSGYSLIPLPSNFYHKEINSIKFYAELYNAQKLVGDEEFMVRYEIVNEGNKQIIGDLVGHKKMKAVNSNSPGQEAHGVNVILAELSLDQVPSGNYSFVIEARTKKNELFAYKSVFFQRSKPIAAKTVADDYSLVDINNTFVSNISNKDTLKDYVACLYPISGQLERQIEDNQLAAANPESMKQFIYYFWSKHNPDYPEQAWLAYRAEVDKVNVSYSAYNRKGYDSDRGRVYLQYGPPNVIDESRDEPNSYPYEVWHYYKLGNQSNRKFVFYVKEGASNNYELLHSDAIGEVNLYDWQLQLHKTTIQYGNDIDASQSPPAYGDRSLDRFNHPK